MRRRLPLACVLAVLALANPLAAQSPNPVAATANLHARYVLLGSSDSGPVAHARAVIDPGYSCPTVTGGASDVAMTTRDNPHHFPIVVCEALVGFAETRQLALADASLPLPVANTSPTKIQVFGDTGCKSKDCALGTPAAPFAALATAAAKAAPDLVLHMGDANYRGTPSHVMFTTPGPPPTQVSQYTYDAGDGSEVGQGCGQDAGTVFYSLNERNSNFVDSWESWRDDFFIPAADLLAAAPWIIARGNHELCSRAGPGWFYFLDTSSNLTGAQVGCPAPRPDAPPIDNVALGEPFAVDLGTLNVVVLDSANACDSFVNSTFQARYDAQLARLPELAPAGRTTWLMQHRPLWGVTEYSSTESTACGPYPGTGPGTGPGAGPGGDGATETAYGCINQTLQRALHNALGGSLPSGVQLVLSGHMHRFQSVTFQSSQRPPQIVIGNSGVELDGSPPLGSFRTPVNGEPAFVLTTGSQVQAGGGTPAAFGYLEITYAADGSWQGVIHDDAGTPGFTLATCGRPWVGRSVCDLAPGVGAE